MTRLHHIGETVCSQEFCGNAAARIDLSPVFQHLLIGNRLENSIVCL